MQHLHSHESGIGVEIAWAPTYGGAGEQYGTVAAEYSEEN
jgi:hypothetical protein